PPLIATPSPAHTPPVFPYSTLFRSQTATLTIVAPSALSALQCNPTSVPSGGTSTCTVTLAAAASAGGSVITLSGNSTYLSTPASVGGAPGATPPTFPAPTPTFSSNT